MTNEYNDLWELDRGDYVSIITELRAALAEAERERVDLVTRLGAGQIEYDSLYAALNDCGIERDEAEQMAWSAAEAEEDARETIERQRRTIRALVVAARVARLAAVGFAFIAGIGPRRVHDEIRFGIKQSKQQADRQAGKE